MAVVGPGTGGGRHHLVPRSRCLDSAGRATAQHPRRPHTAREADLARLNKLATEAKQPVTRQIAYATLINIHSEFETAWNSAIESASTFPDLLRSIPLISDARLRSTTQIKLSNLLEGVLPEVLVEQIGDATSTNGRYVRIELPGKSRTLTLAEVEIFSQGKNIAVRGKASQSATAHEGTADRAIDGNRDGVYGSGSQTHTPENNDNPWWEVDLTREFPIDSVSIWNRTEGDFWKRLDGFTLKVLDERRQVVFETTKVPASIESTSVTVSNDRLGTIERAAIEVLPTTILPTMEMEQKASFNLLANFAFQQRHRTSAIRALARLPKSSWNSELIVPMIENVIDQVSQVAVPDRTEPSVLDELAFAKTLSTSLPRDVGNRYRKQLGELGVNVIVLRPITHMMQYDRTQIFVEAGKPVQIVLENSDIMPHNIVITTPGAYAKVGIAAELMASDPDGVARQFVPEMPEVLHASKMLQPGQIERLNIVAPTQPGEYPYVCTYPGHWRRMYGTMHVVPDLSVIPPEALSPTVDAAVSARPFVREWTLEDLTDSLNEMERFRSFDHGKALFTEMSCLQCHKVDAQDAMGGDVGPTLLELQKKLQNGDIDRIGILKSIIEPSETIDEKYRTLIIQDIDGRVHSGVVAERNDVVVRLLANPLDRMRPVEINVDDIEDELESKVSMMPMGLLNTLTRDEILDLLMYVESAGNAQHQAYNK